MARDRNVSAVPLPSLPPTFASTRNALHQLACYAIAPARKADDGHIGLRPVDGGAFGIPGGAIRVVRDHLVGRDGTDIEITTVRAACEALAIAPSSDPGVGADLPPYAPDEALAVDPAASDALGDWYRFVHAALSAARDALGPTMSEAQLWPEHFDLAADWGRDDEHRANLGGSPGDAFSDEPYLYAGPWDRGVIAQDAPFWNAPFGRTVRYAELLASDDPAATALDLFTSAAQRLG